MYLAEEEGFEPSYPGIPGKRFSRPPHSTTLPPLREAAQSGVSTIITQAAPRSADFFLPLQIPSDMLLNRPFRLIDGSVGALEGRFGRYTLLLNKLHVPLTNRRPHG